MSEQAKSAAQEIYSSFPVYPDPSDKKMIQDIIDAEFAPIIQQRDELLEACKFVARHLEGTGIYEIQLETLRAAIENATKEQK
jgi:hypothetical protein